MGEAPKYYGKRRSIVRRIGSFLPLKPPPKIYVSVTPLHSMTSSMINEETSSSCTTDLNGYCPGSVKLSGSRPDILEPISFGSEIRLLALEQELQELREQIAAIVKTNKHSRHASTVSLSNGSKCTKTESLQLQSPQRQPQSTPAPAPLPPAPPPPPTPSALPPPTTPHIARRASLQDHKVEERRKNLLISQKSMGNVLQDIDNTKLKAVARSPGGRPLRMKRENSPCNDLQEILRKRYITMQLPDSQNSSTLTIDKLF